MQRGIDRDSALFPWEILLCLTLVVAPMGVPSHQIGAQQPSLVPTEVCSCPFAGQGTASGEPRIHAPGQPFATNYDEQLGLTFTQSFASIEYNVTAVEQTDPVLGTGPAYLVNGLSNTGYWYQVGVSYNWSPGSVPGTGFDMNYEVFDTSGNSIFPTNGQGGVASFSGPVHRGDLVSLDLYITSSTRTVTMTAKDTVSGASASESFSSMGSTSFVGLPNSVSNSNGFFTGLMTEWYHGAPYYANEAPVVYTNPHFALSSAWMWMDEFNSDTFQSVFSANTSAPVSFSDPTKLHEFSHNGTTEYANAYEFITGALGNTTIVPSTVPLVFSFQAKGSGSGYTPPVLSYISNGSSHATPLTETPTTYYADNGTAWTVAQGLGTTVSGLRWMTDQRTSGIANSSLLELFVYFEQKYVTFGFTVLGNGSGYSPPTINYSSFGSSLTTSPGIPVWADAGTQYQYSSPLVGSNGTQRWFAESSGTIGSSQQISVSYYLQYLVVFEVSFKNTEVFPALSLTTTSKGAPYSATITYGSNPEWLDSGASYSVPQSFSLEKGQRLLCDGATTGQVSSSKTVVLNYQHQFYVGVAQSPAGVGNLSPQSGWYDSGVTLELSATTSPGWEFQRWQGSGADSVSGATAVLNMTVGPGAPANETAVFYPGITIQASGPGSVSYGDGDVSGTVAGGTSRVVYVPPSTRLSLSASGLPFLTRFQGWSGTLSSGSPTTSLSVVGPATVIAESGYDVLGLGALFLMVALVAATGVWLVRRRRGRGVQQSPESDTTSSGAPR